MGLYISPKHIIFESLGPVKDWDLDFQIDIFLARVDGWHLEIADRCINGWEDEQGNQCINAKTLDGRRANHIPDSGWAVLQIVTNYFEIIGEFKGFRETRGKGHYEKFEWGVFDVFREFKNHTPNVSKILWGHLRAGLYHSGMKGNKIYIAHTLNSKPISFDQINQLLVIDPHKLIPALRQHLQAYGEQLRNPQEVDVREVFREAFISKYDE
jgi:hypothetical protein